MKKTVCLLVTMVMIISLCACNYTDPHQGHNHNAETHTTAGAVDVLQDDIAQSDNTQSDNAQQSQDAQSGQENTEHTHSEEALQTGDYPFTKEATGTLMYKHSVKIDIPFEQEYMNAKSDKEIVSICETYTNKWKTIADRYYKEILYYNGSVPTDPNFSTDKEMHDYVENYKTQWEADFIEDTEDYLNDALKANPNNEQKAQALCAAYKFDLQREFALEMIGIYEILGEFNNQEF